MRCTLSFATVFILASCSIAAEQTNILFIVADDFRPELGCYGSPARTPNLDALAKRGVRFERAYCQQALCNPSRSSFLTGKRPDSLNIWNNSVHFRDKNPDIMTLPQWFKQNNYETRCVGKIFHNWHTKVKGDRRSWTADEFLHYANHGEDTPMVNDLPPNTALPLGREYGKVPLCERRDVPDEAYYDGRVSQEAVKVLTQIQDKPFFLAVGFWKPHAPFNAPKKYWDLYDPKQLPRLNPAKPSGAPAIAFHDSREVLGIPPNSFEPTREQAEHMRHGYYANISYMDAQIGKVIKALDDLKLAERTVIVFVADHGYHIGEHTQWAKTSCFEFDAHVPMIIAEPKSKNAGRSTQSLAELVDLFPTMTDLAQLKTPLGLEGTSLVASLREPDKILKSEAYTQHPRPAYFDRTPEGVPTAVGYSVRVPGVRYTEWRDWKTGRIVGAELYDHKNDPGELKNIVEDNQPHPQLAKARASLQRMFPTDKSPSNRQKQ